MEGPDYTVCAVCGPRASSEEGGRRTEDERPPRHCLPGRKGEPVTPSAWHQQNQNQPFLLCQLSALFIVLLPEHWRLQNFLLSRQRVVSVPRRWLPDGLFPLARQCFSVQRVCVCAEVAGLAPACFLLSRQTTNLEGRKPVSLCLHPCK